MLLRAIAFVGFVIAATGNLYRLRWALASAAVRVSFWCTLCWDDFSEGCHAWSPKSGGLGTVHTFLTKVVKNWKETVHLLRPKYADNASVRQPKTQFLRN